MELSKLAKKHGDKPLRKKDFKRAFTLINKIETELESLLETDKRKYTGTLFKQSIDKATPESKKHSDKEDAEFSVLVSHSLIGDLLDALDSVENKWKQLEAIHTNGVI